MSEGGFEDVADGEMDKSAARARLEGAQLDEWNRQVEDTRAREAATDSETVGDAFEQGLDEGADNIRGAVSGTFNVVGKGLAGVLTGIPFWVWALVILAALQYFGLLRPLVGKLFKGKKA